MTTDTTARAADAALAIPDDPEDLLTHLAKLHLRATASPMPRHPAALGWQATAGALAALSTRLLDRVMRDNPHKAEEIAEIYSGPLGEGLNPFVETTWIGKVVAGPAGAELQDWLTEAETLAGVAFAHDQQPVGVAELGERLGPEILTQLISGLGESWKEWEERGSRRRLCFLPGCIRDFDLIASWAGEAGMRSEGWMSSKAVGHACPEHASFLWAGGHQHTPAWTYTSDGSSGQLGCSCGWASGTVKFRGHGTTLYSVHALEALEAKA